MRRSLSLVLMVVLVLRGLTGTAMAAGVLPSLLQAAASQQSHAHALLAPGEPAAHHEHAAAPADPPHGPGHGATLQLHAAGGTAPCEEADGGCSAQEHHALACSACEICHSAMLEAPALRVPGLAPAGPLRATATAQFDSAPPARAIKPPIA